MLRKIIFIGSFFLLLTSCFNKKGNDELYLLTGTYAPATNAGVYVYKFDTNDGDLTCVSSIKNISNPSYLTISANQKFVYAVSEDEGERALANAFVFDKNSGTLKELNAQQTKGDAPCYINTDKNGQFVVTANYTGGNISVFPTTNDGSLLPASQVFAFQEINDTLQHHLHSVVFSPDGKYLFACDLGADKIYKFEIDYSTDKQLFLKQGNPVSFDLEKGIGPRHIEFHPTQPYVYVIGELSGKVAAFGYNDGNLKEIQYIASDTTSISGKKGSADIHLTPDGRFLYASNRLKSDGIAIFSVNQDNGILTRTGYQSTGIHPRNFIISPNGKFLLVASRDSNIIQVFEINSQTGNLKDINKTIKLDKPVCLKFVKML